MRVMPPVERTRHTPPIWRATSGPEKLSATVVLFLGSAMRVKRALQAELLNHFACGLEGTDLWNAMIASISLTNPFGIAYRGRQS